MSVNISYQNWNFILFVKFILLSWDIIYLLLEIILVSIHRILQFIMHILIINLPDKILVLKKFIFILHCFKIQRRLNLSLSYPQILLITLILLRSHHHYLIIIWKLLRFRQLILQQLRSINTTSFLHIKIIDHLVVPNLSNLHHILSYFAGVDVLSEHWRFDTFLEF